MTIQVALNHRTSYQYNRRISLGPQLVRLRPAPHCRTPIRSYSLKVQPEKHFVNWQQDPHGNFQARFVFPEKTERFQVEVDLVADMTVINPFDFFIEEAAEEFPFDYDEGLKQELLPFLSTGATGPELAAFVDSVDRTPVRTVDFIVGLNARLQQQIKYEVRMEPGVQTPEETLQLAQGSCRDTGWLLVQILRRLGLAARFVSGYLIQLKPDVKSLDGPSGTEVDFTDLHAWAEVFLPGAGWVGLDPTSGLLAGEGHIPLACTPAPSTAAPISGALEDCEVDFDFDMTVTRIHEDPRVTKPYSDDQWKAVQRVGRIVDERLQAGDVRLTMGGEPTFVSIDDMEGEEWNTAAVGPTKRALSELLMKRLQKQFAKGAFLHFGQGKWYPGESLPRWALGCYWRKDQIPAWRNPELFASSDRDYGFGVEAAERFARALSTALEVTDRYIVPVYEDVAHYLLKEDRLPVNVTPEDPKLKDPEERARMAAVFARGVGSPVGFVMPLKRQWWQSRHRPWVSGPWPVRSEKMFLLPGDSPIGLRLPLDSLPWAPASQLHAQQPPDPMMDRPPLPGFNERRQAFVRGQQDADDQALRNRQTLDRSADPEPSDHSDAEEQRPAAEKVVRTALCVEPREGRIYVFMPPVELLEDYMDLLAAIEATAEALRMPVMVEGYLPPEDARLNNVRVTPDPGVIEVNIHPSASWPELVEKTETLYEEARQTRLGTEKFDLDGRHSGTGGGNHIVLGGPTPADSPFLRQPDLLKSLVGYWVNHPSLSYLFSGRFVGPTSQAPRVDEGRPDALYELELAFAQIPDRGDHTPLWLVDRIFRNLLTDLTGNTHRAEFCIDKLYSPDSSTGRLGLVELRGFEMPPHAQMSLTQQLLIRALVAQFWEQPYDQPLVSWGTQLHDRFLLPYFVWQDFADVIADLKRSGFELPTDWFAPHFEFRFPMIGQLSGCGLDLELRAAIEPWNVLGEEPGAGGTVRFVDSSVERLQVRVTGMTDRRFVLACNGRRLPLHPTGTTGEFVAAVRYRAWQPASCLHPTVPVHAPLVFDVIDTWAHRSVAGCTYHVSHPAGRNYESFPVNAYEAEARRVSRFFPMGHTPGPMKTPPPEPNSMFPLTLDLRQPAPA